MTYLDELTYSALVLCYVMGTKEGFFFGKNVLQYIG